MSGVHCISGAVWYSVCDSEFRIDHVACVEPGGIEELKKTRIPHAQEGICGINAHLFHAVEHLSHESLSDAFSLMGWINPTSVYAVDVPGTGESPSSGDNRRGRAWKAQCPTEQHYNFVDKQEQLCLIQD